jgi:hypothetical protein
MCQHIGGTQRYDAEPGAGPHQAVRDLGNRAVAAGGHDHRFAAQHSLPRQCLGMTGTAGFGEVEPHAIGNQHIQYPPQQVRPPASGSRVEYNDHG